jgi:gliding motility-associated-like protein
MRLCQPRNAANTFLFTHSKISLSMKKFTFLFSLLVLTEVLRAQCTAPGFTVNLSAKADTSWTLSGQTRGGTCCGSSNCVTFVVTLSPNSELISFDVTNPAPSGAAFYQVNCGTPVSIGTPLCVVGMASPLTITYCKPGSDKPDYVITAATVVKACADITLQKTSCKDTLTVSNVIPSTVVWTSIYPGAPGAYNSFLSCTSGCTSTIVSPLSTAPPYVDYEVSGTPTFTCGATSDRDTVRVYFVPALTATITPPNPVICASSGSQITLTANPSGGSAPYTYNWSTGPNTQSINISSAGTYTVVVGDATKCPKITLTKTISTLPSATFSYSSPSFCKNAVNPMPVYSNNGQPGAFSAMPAGLSFVNSGTGEINLGASAPGTYTVTNSIPASNGCPNVSASFVVTIDPYPVMTSASSATICTGTALNINLSGSIPASFTWLAGDNVSTTGESLSQQTSALINNTITNTSAGGQLVLYTVTPVATGSGGCTGPAQTVSVTVLPLDNAGFTYSSSTFCQTATYPSATITGLSGGTFTGSSGLVFSNAGNGTIQLSSCNVGNYTVTYSTNGSCPSTATFPIAVTVAPSAVFSYAGSPYCQNQANPMPSFAPGASGGTFSSSAGLIFVSNVTGQIDLGASTPGTYTVTNYIPSQAGCAPASATATITITSPKSATFSYPGSPYCQNAANPSPAFAPGAAAGNFSAQPGLVLNAATGAVNLSASTPGTYTVTNSIAASGGCPAVSATAVISISPLPVATFTYNGTPFCSNGSNPAPVFVGGGTAGVFSASSVFLNMNSSSGLINLSGSSAGSYIVTNTIPAAAGCPAVSATATVSITALPVANFSFTASPYCQNASNPNPSFASNGVNGTFSASSPALSLDPNSGAIDLQASTPGIYTVTNYIAANAGCPAVSASATVGITALPNASFTYGGPYCVNQANPLPSLNAGSSAGTFSAGSGLNLNSSSGLLNLSGSTAGTYTVTNTIAAGGGCPAVSAQAAVTVNAMDDPGFSYPGSTFCESGNDPTPLISGLNGGTFSSTGLAVNASTGVIDLSNSAPGTHTVTYTTAGACPNSSTLNITITNALVANFSYAAASYCSSSANPAPLFAPGASGGIFSGAAGLVIDSLSGTVNLSSSAAGTYTVTNTIAASGGCAPSVATTLLVIDPAASSNAGADQAICYGDTVALNGSISGGASSGTWSGGAGTFSPNANTFNATYTPVSADSLAGSIILTFTTDDPAGVCPAVNDALTITLAQPAVANANADQVICYGTTVNLSGTIGGSASTAAWSGGAGSFSSTLSPLNVTYVPSAADSAAGSVTLILTSNDPAGVCPAASDQMQIIIQQPAVANANVNQTICYGTPVNLAGTIGGSATGASWSGGSGSFSPNNSSLTATYIPTSADSASGIAVLALTTDDPSGVCGAASDTMVISINQPALVSAGADATICYGTTVSLSGSFGGSALNATWSGGAGSFSPANTNLNASYLATPADSAAGSITLTLTTNDPLGVCPAESDQLTLTFHQPATVNAGTNQAICYGTAASLGGVFGGSAGSASWSGGSGAFSPSASVLNATYLPTSADSAAGSVVLTLTTDDPAGACPAVADVMTLTLEQPAIVNAGADQAICYGSSVQLSGVFGGSAGSVTWSGGAGSFVPNVNTAAAVYVPVQADSIASVITLTLTTNDPQGVCPASNDVLTIAVAQPAVVSAGSDQAVCYGSAANLSGYFGGSAGSITWSGGSGAFSPGSNSPSAVYTPTAADSAAGSITLTIVTDDPAGVCPAVSDTLTLMISQPATALAGSDQAICFGSAVTLAGAIGGSAGAGAWTGGSGAYLPNANAPGATYIPSAADSALGSVTLTLTTDDPNGVCPAGSDVMTIMIEQPALVNATAAQAVCAGDTVSLSGSVGGSASSASWSGGAGVFVQGSTSLNTSYVPSASEAQAGSVNLTLTTNDPNGVCPAVSQPLTITINPLPATPTGSAAGYTYCSADPISPVSLSGSGTILWSANASMSPVIYSGAAYSPGSLPVGTTVFYYVDSLGTGCKSAATGSVSITVNANPPVPVISANSLAYCQSGPFGAITSNAGNTAIWSTSPGMNPVVGVGSSYTPAGLSPGTSTFYVADSTLEGCKSVGSASVTVTVYPNPVLSGTPLVDSANCGMLNGGITGVVASGGTPGYTYQWYNGSAAITGANTSTLSAVGPGTYSILVTDANGCAASGSSTSIVVPASTTLGSDFTASATYGYAPMNCVFISTSGGAGSYNWTLGNGAVGSTGMAQTTYTAPGTYTVTLITTLGSCMSVTTKTVQVDGEPGIEIPNVFTPNGDGINDLLTINAQGITELHSEIYNRWGTLIQTLDGVQSGWDGKSNQNESMVDGTYYVILKARTKDGKEIEKQGYVTLLR